MPDAASRLALPLTTAEQLIKQGTYLHNNEIMQQLCAVRREFCATWSLLGHIQRQSAFGNLQNTGFYLIVQLKRVDA